MESPVRIPESISANSIKFQTRYEMREKQIQIIGLWFSNLWKAIGGHGYQAFYGHASQLPFPPNVTCSSSKKSEQKTKTSPPKRNFR
ncbi:hypothetical protein L6452_38910 [Arctium lappa]|uniref:Uncharacterized protein n=1 Tax=Arctium lappa TaxID=4217 RepID=A0ACB8XQD6_ARCLA|nr:hypothetical protein L6452_38910 [Arctium lappa]